MTTKILAIFLICFLLLNGTLDTALAYPGQPVYVLRQDPDGKDYLVKFDTEKDEIHEEILLPENNGFNNFVVDEKGSSYIADYRSGSRNIYYYDSANKKIEHFINLKNNFNPRYMALAKDKLMVEVNGDDGTRMFAGLLFIGLKSKQITSKIVLKIPGFTQTNIDDVFYAGGDNLFFSTLNYNISNKYRDRCGTIYCINVENEKVNQIIDLPEEYKFVDGIVNVGDKIYVAPLGIYDPSLYSKTGCDVGTNDEILVCSLTSGTLVKKIKVSGHPYKLYYDPSVKKIYVQHMDDSQPRNNVEIIDIESDKIIGTLNIPSQLMFSLVKPGKIYVTVGDMFLSPSRTQPGLLVLDTKTDKIIKKIYGNYKGISVNNFVY